VTDVSPAESDDPASMTETFNLSLEQAHAYEDLFVPALFAQWVPTLLDAAEVAPGQRVLDVACGTGVVARQAARLVGPAGGVSGVDLNPAMIEVAREGTSDIDWRVGEAAALPYPDESFDAVVCQSALFFFPEPRQAVEDMTRVVRSGGVVAFQTYAGLDEQPAYGPFVATVARIAGDEATRLMGTYWSQGDLEELSSLLAAAGLEATAAHTTLGHVRFPSLDAFVHTEIQATPLASQIEAGTYSAIVSEARDALADHEQPDGSVVLPIRACFVAGRKP
jgi:ubiquinone/menaquinone biosynthesis C-methylase UbiE